MRYVGQNIDGINIMGLTLISFITGMGLRKIKEKGKLFLDVVIGCNEVAKIAVKLILWYVKPYVQYVNKCDTRQTVFYVVVTRQQNSNRHTQSITI